MFIICPFILKKIGGVKVNAMALFPFIILKNLNQKEDENLIYHEKIHWRQQIELLLIGFYILYLFFYFKNRWNKMNPYQAYLEIPFEKEAYNDTPLRKNKWFGWLKFIK